MIQDIEAEDHILGPLSLRQFIYALISAFFLYINFLCLTKHLVFLLIVFLPPALFTGFFAFPFGGDQPTEVWALAKIRFLFKPRKRIWDQSGVKELVKITVPKKIERNLTNGLSQTEVQSRLNALANTIDSRGWAVKNVNINLYANPGSIEEASDRLVDINSLPREVPNYDVQAADDIMDERSNPIAQQFDSMINASAQAHRQQLMQRMNSSSPVQTAAAPATDYWFLNQIAGAAPVSASPVAPVAPVSTDLSEEAFMAKVHAAEATEQQVNANMHTLQPLGAQDQRTPTTAAAPLIPQTVQTTTPASPPPANPVILSLAGNNDLNIATLARQAEKTQHRGDNSENEIVVSLR
jgi:hypothetical protein